MNQNYLTAVGTTPHVAL